VLLWLLSLCVAQEMRKYDLKKRFYLGPTSLDHSLALVLATISRVQPGSWVLDPFVGTASILVSICLSIYLCFSV
jgi:tRNA G10  N-methylase Trm11